MQFPNLTDIQKRRKILGMTQNQLAKQVGISQSLLTKIERGIVVPNYQTAAEIFNVLEGLESNGEKLARDSMNKNVITLRPSDTVLKAINLVKKHSISQFPVMEGHKMVGSVASVDLIGKPKNSTISEILEDPFPAVNETTPIGIVKSVLKSSRAVVVMNKGELRGIITAEDLI